MFALAALACSCLAQLELSGIRTTHKTYVASEGSTPLHCKNDSCSEHTQWFALTSESSAATIFLRDAYGRFLQADPAGALSTVDTPGNWAQWWWEDAEYLRNVHGGCLSCEPSGAVTVAASRSAWCKLLPCGAIMEGYLQKREKRLIGSSVQRRFYRLSERQLSYWADEDTARGSKRKTRGERPPPKGWFDVADMQRVKLSPSNSSHIIITLQPTRGPGQVNTCVGCVVSALHCVLWWLSLVFSQQI